MDKSDYLDFISEINIFPKDVYHGAFSIWMCNQKENYGYKIFFKKWGGPLDFLVSNKIYNEIMYPHYEKIKKLNSKYKGYELLEMDKLKDYFNFCNKLFNLNIAAEPLEIFNYKSFYGIKYQNLPPVTSDKLWEDRYDTLLPIFNKIWIESYSKWLLNFSQIHNFGQINNNLLMLDIDVVSLERTL